MNYFINKFQQGGVSPFVGYQWTPYAGDDEVTEEVSSSSSASSKSSDESKNNLNLKDLLKLVEGMDLLPNEIANVTRAVQQMYRRTSMLGEELSQDSIVNTYLSVMQLIKSGKFNKEEYKKAYDNVNKNGGLNDVAIDQHGYLRVIDKDGNMQAITAEEFMKNHDQYRQALTNSDLLNLRANSPNTTFDNSLLGVVENGIGQSYVMDMIQKALSKIGTEEVSKEGYTSNFGGGSIQGAMQILAEAQQQVLSGYDREGNPVTGDISELITPEGLYKNKLLTKSQYDNVNKAMSALWRMMPVNVKSWLALNGGDTENPMKGGFDLMAELMYSSTNSSFQFSTDLDKSRNADGSTKSESGGGDKTKMSAALTWLLGHGYNETIIIQNGTSEGLPIRTFSTGITHNNTPIGETTLDKVRTSDFGSILDFENIYMGDQKIINSSNCIINGNQLYSMELPIDQEAAAQGIYKPDFRYLPLIEEANAEIAQKNITDPDEINKIYAKHHLPVKYVDGELLDTSVYMRFGVLNGYATDTAFGSDSVDFSDWVDEVDDDNEIEGKIRILNEGRGEKDKMKFDKKSKWDSAMPFWDSHNTLYKGTIYIPVHDSYINAMTGSGNLPTQGEITSLEQREQHTSRYNELNSLFKRNSAI